MTTALLPRLAVTALLGGTLLGLAACSAPSATSGATTADRAVPAAAVQHSRVGDRTADGLTILNSVRVGDDEVVLGRIGDDVRFAASIDGAGFDRSWELFGPADPAPVARDAFVVVSSGSFPEAAPQGLAEFSGRAGADVTAVDVLTIDGDTVHASVEGGTVLGAWQGRDFTDADSLGVRYVVHLADGSTRTVTG